MLVRWRVCGICWLLCREESVMPHFVPSGYFIMWNFCGSEAEFYRNIAASVTRELGPLVLKAFSHVSCRSGIPHEFEADLHLGIRFKWAEDDGNRKKDSHENTLPPVWTTQSVTPSTLYYFPEIKNHGTLPSSVYHNTTLFQVVAHVKHQ